jgi:hypothetical protein
MRYAVYVTKGEPPTEKPVGMNDLLGIVETSNGPTMALKLAKRKPNTQLKKDTFNVGSPDFTHIGVWTMPRSNAPCELVLIEQL